MLPVWFFTVCNLGIKRSAGLTAICALFMILTVSPWTVRNYSVHGKFIPVSTNGGVNLWIGNNPNATGDWIDPSDYRTPAASTEYEIDREYYNEALRYISSNPGRAIVLALKKFIILWNPYPHYFDQIPFWIIIFFAIIGLAVTWRQKNSYLFISIIFYYSLFACVFFANQRFHIPLQYLLTVFTASGLIWVETHSVHFLESFAAKRKKMIAHENNNSVLNSASPGEESIV